MRTTKILTLFLSAFFSVLNANSQEKWDLRRCVEYALANNISIKQADIDSRTAKLTYEQAKYYQFGQANASTNLGLNFGRSISGTTNTYTNQQALSQTYNLNVGITLFNWFALRRSTESNKLYYDAQVVNIEKLKNDVTLNVAAAYLQALLSREQVTLARTKLFLTKHQLDNTRALVDAGSLPELNAAELEVQFATDTAAVITAQESYDINNLQLKAILNLDAASPFDLDTPPVETIPVEPIASLQPAEVYAIAVGTFPQQKMNDLRIGAAQKNVDYNRGRLYPTLSAYGTLGSNFFNDLRYQQIVQSGYLPTNLYADNSGAQYPVYTPNLGTKFSSQAFAKAWTGYGQQLDDHFGQGVGLQLVGEVAQGLNPAGFSFVNPVLDGGQHVVTI